MQVSDRSQAMYYVEMYKDTLETKLYLKKKYLSNGTLLETSQCRDSLGKEAFGHFTSYYSNGNKKSAGRYNGDTLIGAAKHWYYNGQLWYEEIMVNRPEYELKYKISNCWDSLGRQTATDGDGQCLLFSSEIDIYHYLNGPIIDGYKSGKWFGYYPDYDVSFEEDYIGNYFVSGISRDKWGKEYPYKLIVDDEGFINTLLTHIGSTVIYPKEARRKGIEGKVFISFNVSPEGKYSNHSVVKGIGYGCDESAINSIKAFRTKWNWGKTRGQKLIPLYSRYFVVPIDFQLTN
jgi:TonB family protein